MTYACTPLRNIVAMERATISSNNRQAFKRAGLEIQSSVIPNVAIVRKEYLNNIIDNSCLSESNTENFHTEFGWINKKFFEK